jgi:hypothetical protein
MMDRGVGGSAGVPGFRAPAKSRLMIMTRKMINPIRSSTPARLAFIQSRFIRNAPLIGPGLG